MAVAKSYKDLPKQSDPFMKDGKMWITVLHTKGPKDVRWYTEAQYAALYHIAAQAAQSTTFNARTAFGFGEAGYITIYKGNPEALYKRLHGSKEAWFNNIFTWYTTAEMPIPQDLPKGTTPIRLDWNAVSKEDKYIGNDNATDIVQTLLFIPSNSRFQGKEGLRLSLEVTVTKAIPLTGTFGESTMHIMEDDNENVYVWATAAKCWKIGSRHKIAGTVKEHREYRKTQQTVLTRCREIS